MADRQDAGIGQMCSYESTFELLLQLRDASFQALIFLGLLRLCSLLTLCTQHHSVAAGSHFLTELPIARTALLSGSSKYRIQTAANCRCKPT